MPATLNVDAIIIEKLRKRYAGLTEEQVRVDLHRNYTDTWNGVELLTDFEAHQFTGATVEVIRKSDGKRGTVGFIDEPRVYFAFIADA